MSGRSDRVQQRSSTICYGALGVAVAFAVAASVTAIPAQAQKYPERPVRIVLPFGAGGVADITSRLAADRLSEKLGQRFTIENRPGAGGIDAARAVTGAQPDGYTLGLVTNGTAVSVALFKSLPFDPVNDFAMISTLGYFDLVFATNAGSEFATLGDFLKAARAQPGKLNIGTISAGSSQHLAAELFKSTAGINVQLVPYKTTGEVIVALLRNDIQMLVEFYSALRSPLGEKKIRPVASSRPTRSKNLPEVPTVQEAGIGGYEVTSWNGLFAPLKTPKAVIDVLNKAMHEVLPEPEVQKRYFDLGVEAKASTPEELKARLVGDIKKWSDVIEKAKIPKR
jgi:tripartite-type tricarboxylate transporter receptor subunit TctC